MTKTQKYRRGRGVQLFKTSSHFDSNAKHPIGGGR